ncbi:hypothetical protein IW261DRAFT_1569324 [Armillaria novae-zelandiae]|uniref:MYND-type domain-containing protein n=1 Tax=Armillaria novae-zelandiae TaxID=153914 RepID=A0AA39NY02_9AGAR|nr:hypothetical protein IW261DRAFT_1569324 [Armillaria novae-zelandiae]
MSRLRPDKHKYRQAWNQSWEDELLDRYPPGQYPLAMTSAMSPQSIRFLRDTESLLSSQLEKDIRTKEMCLLQRDLGQAAVTGLSNDNLEERWRSLSQQRREELVLEGLYVTACVTNGMESWRVWCPEMTIATLSGTNDRDFIHLLKMLLPHDQVKETLGTPLLLENLAFEELVKTNDIVLTQIFDGYRLKRSYFITMTVWSILNAFYDNREEIQVGKPLYRDNSRPIKDVLRQAKKFYKDEGRLPQFSKDMRDYSRRKEAENHQNICFHCSRKEDVSAEGERFRICSKCKAVDRVVRYCSVECQKKDWKHGFPRPHKAICGKVTFDEEKASEGIPDSETENTELESGIPPPDPSFKRSPDLLHQISFITKSTPCDYVYMRPRPFDDIGIDIPDITGEGMLFAKVVSILMVAAPEDKVMFTAMRRQAMINGDPAAVLGMYEILRTLTPASISEDQLKTQLRKEYGVDVDLLGDNFCRDKKMASPGEEGWRIVKELVCKKLRHRIAEKSFLSTGTKKELVSKEATHRSVEHELLPAELELKYPDVENSHPPSDTKKELVREEATRWNVEPSHPSADSTVRHGSFELSHPPADLTVTHGSIEHLYPPADLELKAVTHQNVEEPHPPTGIFYLLVALSVIFLVPDLLSAMTG